MAFFKLALPSRFEVVRRIGSGGMGVVYEAIDLERRERVALKTILHHDADTVARVKHEFRALQDIHHPNLVGLRELVADADDVFFTMELVDGVELRDWIGGPARRGSTSNAPTAANVDRAGDVATIEPVSGVVSTRAVPTEAPSFDEERLRDTFRQIALGLSALHAAAKVHRDVKPSNVRVTPEGRVVLLDFGLVFEVSARQLTEHGAVGTPAYMAPEQMFTGGVGPPADWYAVGVMLYECFTGRRPFEGRADKVLAQKRFDQAPAPSTLAPGIPRDLEELCIQLLRYEPAERPGGDEVLRRLRARTSVRPASTRAPFVGRDDELGALRHALSDVEAGRAVTVALYGESGVGKSCLVRHLIDEELAGRDDVMVLSGRCYEREAVPYKALDEIIEMLSRRLARMPKSDVLALLPPEAGALALLFPAMERVPALEGRGSLPDRDPLERRRAAFRALRQTLFALAERQRVVVTIDDLQWTDADSLELLQEVMRPPGAPAILLVLTMRYAQDAAGGAPPLVASLAGDVRAVEVGRLPPAHARALAQALLSGVDVLATSDAEAIAAEAGGHPLFIDELVRHAGLPGAAPSGILRLDDALLERASRLDAPARRVLDVTCMLGAPASQEVVANAAGVDMGELARVVSLLRATHFVRTDGARVTDAIEPFHDRVREAVVARLDEGARRDCHARIAAALERSNGADPEVLATHFLGAGDDAKAATHTLLAAEQAARALAFRRSARLFERALALLPALDERRRAVYETLADALANAGECAPSAAAFERAAERATGSAALDLRRRAAEQLLRAGDPEHGLAAARSVLAAVDLPLPASTLGAILTFLWLRLRVWLRGTRFTPRKASDVAPADLTRIDVCWSVAFTLPFADPLSAGVCHSRHVLLALDVGEPVRAARALAMEASYMSATGFSAWPKAERVLVVARATADDARDPYAQAIVTGLGGIAAFAATRFRQAIDELTVAVARFESLPGAAYESANASFFLFCALAYTARYKEVRPLVEKALEAALARGDRFAAVMLRLGVINSTWLFSGELERARREIAEARKVLPDEPFRAVHHQALIAASYADVYAGDHAAGYARLHDALPAIRRALLMFLSSYRVEIAGVHARLALACAADATGRRREELVREAEALIASLGTVPNALGRVNVRMVRASAAMLRGDRAGALALVAEMAADEDPDAWLSSTTARLVLARAKRDAAAARAVEDEVRAAGGVVCAGLVRITFPAFGDLASSTTAP